MQIYNPINLLFRPVQLWQALARCPVEQYRFHIIYPILLAILPAVAFYFGVTENGWSVGGGDVVKLTETSAQSIVALFYGAMVVSIVVMGYMTHWMSATYGAETSVAKGISVIGFLATPLFVAGLVGFLPVLWFNLLVGIAATSWCIYLLYSGLPIVMNVPEDRGFLYASAIVCIALVMVVCILVASILLWDLGFYPEFTD